MHTYIDESGNCTQVENPSNEFGFDCVAAVVFNDEAIAYWNEKYADLGKGKDLNEDQAQEILRGLAENRVKAFIVATNCKSYSKTIVEEHRADYILSMDAVSKNEPEWLRESVLHHMGLLAEMHPQDYVKTMMINKLVENVIRGVLGKASVYIVNDFENFIWRCDHVSKKTYSTIKNLVCLQINNNSKKKSIDCDDFNKIPNLINQNPNGRYLDAAKILDGFDFQSDDECNGIKAADCIANFLRRVFREKLMLHDFSDLGMILDLPYSIELLHFNKDIPFIETQLNEHGSGVLKLLQESKNVLKEQPLLAP